MEIPDYSTCANDRSRRSFRIPVKVVVGKRRLNPLDRGEYHLSRTLSCSVQEEPMLGTVSIALRNRDYFRRKRPVIGDFLELHVRKPFLHVTSIENVVLRRGRQLTRHCCSKVSNSQGTQRTKGFWKRTKCYRLTTGSISNLSQER